MQYRILAGETVSQLGFGAMRMPMAGGTVDLAEAERLILAALDGGINYIDTAWIYHGGTSEGIVGRAIRHRPRHSLMVATKSPVWDAHEPADFTRFLNTQLQRLQTDYIDFYLLHALNAGSWAAARDLGVLDFLDDAKAQGKIRHVGFSFHDAPEVFPTILDAYPWEFTQIQYNYLDRDPAHGHPGLASPASRGTGIIIMEPLRGGNLAGPLPAVVQEILDRAPIRRSPVEWALRWIWHHPEPALVLSGMSTMAQLEQNLTLARGVIPGSLSPRELDIIDEVAALLPTLTAVPCTRCRYCMPCPFGVDIPRNFSQLNDYTMFAQHPSSKAGYQWIPEAERAQACTACGACIPHCPQGINIPLRLSEVAATLGV